VDSKLHRATVSSTLILLEHYLMASGTFKDPF
jgi:hypothetical protein